ncbi:MAG: lysylphosphatidylglycerol synthase transmembrane domain-containing protein [Candidatus Jordarchaeales archaeon]
MVNRGMVLKAVALLLSVAFIVLVLWVVGVDLFLGLASRLHPAWVLTFIAVYTLSFVLRAVRWKIIVDAAGGNVSVFRLMTINFSGWLINEVTPAKVGDLLRISLLSSQGGLPLGESTSTIAVERALDVVSIAIISSIILSAANLAPFIPLHIKLVALILFAILAVIVALTLALCVAGPGVIDSLRVRKISERIYNMLQGLALGIKEGIQKLSKNPKALTAATLLSLPIWFTDALSIYIFLNAAGIPWLAQAVMLAVLAGVYPSILLVDTVTLALFTQPFSSISVEICMLAALLGFASKFFPVIPGGFGVYEIVIALVLGVTSLPLNLGLAVALLDHMARLTYCSAAGVPSLVHNGVRVSSAVLGFVNEKPKTR